MSKILKRYEKLRLREYELRAHYYPFVCKELSLILRNAYTKIPKNLQSILLEDILAAFRFLLQVENRSGMEAANLLLQAVEAVLPKQKRVLAVSEFKRVVVALKRRQKAQKDVEGVAQLPQDVLFQIFCFLDICSLVIAGLVCWSWNSAANDNKLWQSQYEICFGVEPPQKSISSDKDQVDMNAIDWREDFRKTYIANLSRRFSSNRGYCDICNSVVWLSNMKCSNEHCGGKTSVTQIEPVSPQQIVEHLLGMAFSFPDSDSDSDNDSEFGPSKLWDYGTQWII